MTNELRGDCPTTAAPVAVNRSHVAINTTTRCQHRCVYCFEGKRTGIRDVSYEDTCAQLDELATTYTHIIFMGAEPTLNPRIVELTRHARSRGLSVAYSTNALRFADKAFLDRCTEAGLSDVELSFPYPDASVYAAITRAAPKGFAKLLAALDNIAAHGDAVREGRSAARTLGVNVNVVVSRANIARLDEVFGLLRRHLGQSQYVVTLRRLDLLGDIDLAAAGHLSVPLAELRAHLPPLLQRVAPTTDVLHRGFPLCAVPGWEHLDADLLVFLERAQIRQNFFLQDTFTPMYSQESSAHGHRYEWLCAACDQAPLCVERGLFLEEPLAPDRRPVPHRGPLPAPLAALVDAGASGEDLFREIRAQATPYLQQMTGLLRALRDDHVGPAAQVPPAWEPLDTGAFLLQAGGVQLRVRAGLPRRDWGPFVVHAGWGLELPAQTPGMAWSAGLEAAWHALRDALARHPAPAMAGAEREDAWFELCRRLAANRVGVESPDGGAALAFKLRRVGGAVAGIDLVPASAGGAHDSAFVWRIEADDASQVSGFLCDALSLTVGELVLQHASGRRATQRLATFCAVTQRSVPGLVPPDAPGRAFHQRAWQAFGPLLLPSDLDSVHVEAGEVTADHIVLRWRDAQSKAVTVEVRPGDGEGGSSGCLVAANARVDGSPLARVLARYERRAAAPL